MNLRCFVAMAFGRLDADKVYEKLIKTTIKKNGITPIRIDKKPHNNDIDDEMIMELQKANFIIADLTYARPSVYFEAGFGEGFSKNPSQIPKPVIYTCRKDHLSGKHDDAYGNFKIHFDLQMKNIIPWSNEHDKNFQKKLSNRINLVCRPLIKENKENEIEKQLIHDFEMFSSLEKNATIIDIGYSILQRLGYKPEILSTGYPYNYHRSIKENYNIKYPYTGMYSQRLKPNLLLPTILSKRFSKNSIQTIYLHASSTITKTLLQYMYRTLLSRPIYNLSPPDNKKISELNEILVICSPNSFNSKKLMEYLPEFSNVNDSFIHMHEQIIPNSKSNRWKKVFYIDDEKFEGHKGKDREGYLKNEEYRIVGNYLTYYYEGKNYNTIDKEFCKLKKINRVLQINILESIKHEKDFTSRFKGLLKTID